MSLTRHFYNLSTRVGVKQMKRRKLLNHRPLEDPLRKHLSPSNRPRGWAISSWSGRRQAVEESHKLP